MAVTNGYEVIKSEDWLGLIDRNRETDWIDVTPDQRVFAQVFIVTSSIKQASEAAGVSAEAGATYLRNPLFVAYLNEIRNSIRVSENITKEFLVNQMMNLIPILSGEVPVPHLLPNGEQIQACVFRPKELISVLGELGKTVPEMNTANTSSGAGVTVNINMSRLLGSSAEVIDAEVIESND